MNVAQTNLQLYRQLSERKATSSDLATVRRGYELAASLFRGVYRASGKPFIAHLIGTASVLVQDGAPLPLVHAGLLHAAYVQGDFGDGPPGATAARRRRVGEAIGADAEQLVARYTTLPWHAGDLSAHRDLPASLEPLDRDVLRIRLANEVEELVDFCFLYHRDAESRRALAIQALPVWMEWAKTVSAEAIAAELGAKAVPLSTFHAHEALQTDRVLSYRPPSAFGPTVAGRVRGAVDRLRGVARRLRHAGLR